MALLASCSRKSEQHTERTAQPAASAPASALPHAPSGPGHPALLYLPDGGDIPPSGVAGGLLPGPIRLPTARCPPDMVDVRSRFCIDRYEASLLDARSGRTLSPYYHPTRAQTRAAFEHWSRRARGSGVAVPEPPSFQLSEEFEPRAESRADVVPSGYLSATLAELACRNAGKRLCTLDEWVLACRGERGTRFPYGDRYQVGACNVFREAHPAEVLHGDSSVGHLDPRLNQVEGEQGPLLRRTGQTQTCRSVWGDDAAYDMVGNLDEWVDPADHSFVGGFYARGTREGCQARISSHAVSYFDYSLGTRCCL